MPITNGAADTISILIAKKEQKLGKCNSFGFHT